MQNNIAQEFYVALTIIGCVYFLFRKRDFDYLSLGFFSSLIYFMPLFFGWTYGGNMIERIPILPEVYYIGSAIIISLLLAAETLTLTLSLQGIIPVNSKSMLMPQEGYLLELLTVLACIGLIATIVTAGSDLLSTNKTVVMSSLSRFYILAKYASIMGLVWSFRLKRNAYFIFFLILLLFDIYIGFRLSAAIASLSVILIWLMGMGKVRLFEIAWERKKSSIAIIMVFAFFFIYKQIYILIKAGLWGNIQVHFLKGNLLNNAVFKGEPFITQSILNNVIKEDFSIKGDYLFSNVFQFIPFSNNLGSISHSFNDMFQPILFSSWKSGMAGNWWAEWFAAFSWWGMIFAVLIYVGTLFVFSYFHIRHFHKVNLSVLLTVLGVFCAFYIHRNDITFFITLEKRVVWLWLFVIGLNMIIQNKIQMTKTKNLEIKK